MLSDHQKAHIDRVIERRVVRLRREHARHIEAIRARHERELVALRTQIARLESEQRVLRWLSTWKGVNDGETNPRPSTTPANRG